MKTKRNNLKKLCALLLFALFGTNAWAEPDRIDTTFAKGEVFELEYTVPTPVNGEELYVYISTCGGVKLISDQPTGVREYGEKIKATFEATGYASGEIAFYIWSEDQRTHSQSVYNGCYTTLTIDLLIGTSMEIYRVHKTFELPNNYEISGHKCVEIGNEYIFSVDDLFTPMIAGWRGCVYGNFQWSLPDGLVETGRHPNGNAITVRVDGYPTEAIQCTVGHATQYVISKTLKRTAKIPEIKTQPNACIASAVETVTIELENPEAGFDYDWILTNTDWLGHKFTNNGTNTFGINVDVFTSSGQIILRVFGECDTAYHTFQITRSIGGEATKIVQEKSVEEGQELYYSIYPSPNQHITWTFPEGWQEDDENPYSSTVFVSPKVGEATSGKIIATAKLTECASTGDTLDVYIKTYPPAPIYFDDPNEPERECFSRNVPYTFVSNTVRHGKMYVWTFPEGWSKTTDTVREWQDGKVRVTATPGPDASNDKITLSVYGELGNDRKDTVYHVKFTPKDIEDVVNLTGCLNKGMNTEDITYMIVNPENGVDYMWQIPNNWIVGDSFPTMMHFSTIEQTLDEADNTYPLIVYGTNTCGNSKNFTLNIKHSGMEYYAYGTLFDPSLEFISDMYCLNNALPCGDDYDTWVLFLTQSDENIGDVQYNWFADDYSVNNYIYESFHIREYSEGEAYMTLIYHLGDGSGCKTKLGKQLVVESIYSTPSASPTNVRKKKSNTSTQISIHPNPANSAATVVVPDDITATKYGLCNMNGQVLKHLVTTDKTFTMDVSDLPNGIYFLRTFDGSRLYVSKLVVSK